MCINFFSIYFRYFHRGIFKRFAETATIFFSCLNLSRLSHAVFSGVYFLCRFLTIDSYHSLPFQDPCHHKLRDLTCHMIYICENLIVLLSKQYRQCPIIEKTIQSWKKNKTYLFIGNLSHQLLWIVQDCFLDFLNTCFVLSFAIFLPRSSSMFTFIISLKGL